MTFNYSATVASSIANTQSLLNNFLNDTQSQNSLLMAFGDEFNIDTGLSLIESLGGDDLASLVNLEILSSGDINNAFGAYSAGNNTIYLSTELLDSGDTDTISRVLLEEIGHYLDAQGNSSDAPGDEGAIFASLVLGEELDSNELALLQAEDDTATVVIDGETVDIEQMITIFVNDDATGTNDGTSWANAYTDLQAALRQAVAGDEIWVAAGSYRPTTGNDRDISFNLTNGVAVYGGFAGGETSLDARNIENNLTILSGDIGAIGNITDNSYSVVEASSTNNNTILDGFTISDGNANVSNNNNDRGAGIYARQSNATFSNLIISNNNASDDGAGIYNDDSNSVVLNTIFRNNTAGDDGGAIYNDNQSSIVITAATFESNTAQNGGAIYNSSNSTVNVDRSSFLSNSAIAQGTNTAEGGAVYNGENTNAQYTNSIFNNNTSQLGGAIYNDNNNSLGVNNTFANNQAERGAAVFSDQGTPRFENSIFWNNTGTVNNAPIFNDDANTVVANSIVQGGYNGENIIDLDPQFVDLQSGDLRLTENSPGIDAGNNLAVIGEEDIDGNARIVNGTVDIGAYEATDGTVEPPVNPEPPVLPVNPEPSGSLEYFRFRNTNFPTGSYVFVAGQEGNAILNDPNLSGSFALDGLNSDGSVNPAFVASTEPGENLEGFFRLSSIDNPGTFLFVGQQEYDAIFAPDSDQRDRWDPQGFDTDGITDIPEFYLYGVGAGLGTPFNRFQNRENNTFLFAGPRETEAINNDPNLSAAFINQGGAFESFG